MKTLENQILVIDDKEAAVNYKHSEINNEQESYKISFDDFIDLFWEDANHTNLFKYDTSNVATLILDSGEEISMHKYKTGMKVVLLRLMAPELDGNDIIISVDKNHLISCQQWSNADEKIYSRYKDPPILIGINFDSMEYTDGYQISQDCIYQAQLIRTQPDKNLLRINALTYCNDLTLHLGNSVYQGYLPATEQLRRMDIYETIINTFLNHINADPINFENMHYWSCCENSAATVWTLNQMSTAASSKQQVYEVFPFFKKIK